MAMRRGLIWALGATGALTAAALWTESKPAKVVAAIVRPDSLGKSLFPPGPTAALTPLPPTLPAIQVEPAQRDIFAPVEPPPPKLVAPPPAPPPPPPPPPPAPMAPALSLRYLGTMVTPTGERIVLLARGEVSVPVQPGTKLEEGYVVEAVDGSAVHLLYPPLGTKVDIPIPPAAPPSQ